MSLITESTPAERSRGLIFSELFKNAEKVIKNGGTIVSAPTINNGLTTDGTDDEVTYTEIAKNVQTISFWVTLQTTTEDIMQLSATHSIEAGTGTLTATGVTAPTFYVNGAATATITTARSHVVITTGTAFDADAIQIGQDASFGQFKIEDLKMWTVALTAVEVTDLANDYTYDYINESVFDLPMNMENHDPTNTRALDLRNSNHAALTGTTKNTDELGYNFNGTSDLMTITHDSSLDIGTGEYTFSMWAKIDTLAKAQHHTMICKGDPETSTGWIFQVIATGATPGTMNLRRDAGNVYVSTQQIREGSWNNLVVQRVGSSNYFFLNGVLDATSGVSAADLDNNDNMTMGYRNGAYNGYLTGNIAGMKFWDSALTQTQIRDLYQRELKKFNII